MVYDKNIFWGLLKNYEHTVANLDSYLQRVLIKNIKTEAFVGKFSRWRLLYKKSDKELPEALQILGRREPEISCFIFARKYFKQVYLVNRVKVPTRQTGQKWPEPEAEDFSAAAQCYNAEKSLPSTPHEVSASATVTGEQLQAWMQICIQALQNYPKSITPHFSLESLETSGYEIQFEEPNNSLNIELQADSAAGEAGQGQSSLAKKIDAVFREKLKSFNNVVEKEICDEILLLDKDKILPFYYGFGLTQKQLEARVGIKQYTIYRQLTKYERQLLDSLAGLSQPNQWVKQYVEGWLVQDYKISIRSDLIQAALVEAIKNLDSEQQEILQLRYNQKLDEKQVANALNINQNKITNKLNEASTKLQNKLLTKIKNWA